MNIERPHFFGLIAGLFLATGLVLSAMLVTRAWIHVQESASINVTGSATKEVVADLVIWSGSFQVVAAALTTAQANWALARESGLISSGAWRYELCPFECFG